MKKTQVAASRLDANSKSKTASNLQALLISLGLGLLVAGTFGGAIRADFINFDDRDYVLENPQVLSGLTWPGTVWALRSGHAANWHPLTWLSHMLDVEIYGLNPAGHHATGLLLHALNAVLVFLLFRRLTGATWRSALAAAVFAVHPLRVESVAWVSERKDVLCAFFGLLALLAYAKYAQSKTESGKQKAERGQGLDTSPGNTSSGLRPPSPQRGEGNLPDRGGEGGRDGRPISEDSGAQRSDAPYLGPSAIRHPPSSRWYWLALLFFALGLMSKPMLVTWPFVMLLLDVWPLKRAGRWELEVGSWKMAVASWKPLVIEKLPFFGITVLSSLITYLVQAKAGAVQSWQHYTLLDRVGNALVAYLRYLGNTFWPVNLSAYYEHPGQWPIATVVGAALCLLGISAVAVWLIKRRPYMAMGWFWFLGILVPVIGVIQVGGQSLADRYTYLPSIGLSAALIWGAAGLGLQNRGLRITAAAASVGLLAVLSWLTAQQTRHWQNSEMLFRHALKVEPDNYMAHFCLGNALLESGQESEGRAHLLRTRELSPNFANVHGKLGYLAANEGNYEAAVAAYRTMLELRPNSPEALNNLAWLRATCPNPAYRDGMDAVKLAEQACELSHYEKTIYIGTLAAAYAEAGRFAEAMATAQRAHDRALAWGETLLAKRNLELMQHYRSGSAFHEERNPKSE